MISQEGFIKTCLVDSLFEELTKFPFPENESDTTKQELNELVDYLEDMDIVDNEKIRKDIFSTIETYFKQS